MPLPIDRALREGVASALAHRSSTVILVLLTLATTLAVFLTAGRSAAVESEVLARIDEAGPRLVTVQVLEPSPGIDRSGLGRLSRATGVEWALGLGEAREVSNASLPGGAKVVARRLLTDAPDILHVSKGRAPAAGEAIVSESARELLGLAQPSGTLDDGGRLLPVVGQYGAGHEIADLERLVLVGAEPRTTERATLVYLLANSTANVPLVTAQLPALSGLDGGEGVNVSTSEELLRVEEAVGGELSRFGRTMALGALGAGLVLMALATALAQSSRRRDHGRRRALGASRTAIVAVAILEVAFPVGAGAALGTAAGGSLVHRLTGHLPEPSFMVAVPVLVLIIGMVATVVPATAAALQDPVRILRVP